MSEFKTTIVDNKVVVLKDGNHIEYSQDEAREIATCSMIIEMETDRVECPHCNGYAKCKCGAEKDEDGKVCGHDGSPCCECNGEETVPRLQAESYIDRMKKKEYESGGTHLPF